MSSTSAHTPNRLDSREGLLAELAVIDGEGWDGPAGRRLLSHVRSHIVRPQVAAAGLRGPVGAQAEATGWAAAWETLARASIRTATSPWGLLWVAVRRAVLGEIVASTYQASARNAWRAASTRHEQLGCAERRGAVLPTVSLDSLVERGWEPAAEMEPAAALGPRLEAVVSALADAGWAEDEARAVVEAVAVSAVRNGRASSEAQGWRPLAARLKLPPWRVRRVTVLLLGAPGWPGLIERMTHEGSHVLEDEALGAALRSTAISWWPPPPMASRKPTFQKRSPPLVTAPDFDPADASSAMH